MDIDQVKQCYSYIKKCSPPAQIFYIPNRIIWRKGVKRKFLLDIQRKKSCEIEEVGVAPNLFYLSRSRMGSFIYQKKINSKQQVESYKKINDEVSITIYF